MEKEKTKIQWTTQGSVRGGCGHLHTSYARAIACRDEDREAMRKLSSSSINYCYSDRQVLCLVDGVDTPFDLDPEHEAVIVSGIVLPMYS